MSCEKDSSWFSGRVTFPSLSGDGLTLFLIDYGLGIRAQKCDDCKTSSETFDKQREFLLNQDRQILQGHTIQKISKEQIKQIHTKLKVTEKQLTGSLTNVAKAASEITNLKVHLQVETD